MARISRIRVKRSLLSQLRFLAEGYEPSDHFVDLVEDYMKLWDVKVLLQKDIKRRGVSFRTPSASGSMIEKQNPSTKELVMVTKQMLSMLKELNLTTDEMVGDTDDQL